jgi:hypothetical protein
MGGGSGSGGHVTTSANFFRMAEDMVDSYEGREAARGIMCDKWIAMDGEEGDFLAASGGNPGRSGTWRKLEYFYSIPEYSLPESGSTRVPIRLRMTGQRTSLTREACTPSDGGTSCSLTKVVEAGCEAIQLVGFDAPGGVVTTCTLNADKDGCDQQGDGACTFTSAVTGACATVAEVCTATPAEPTCTGTADDNSACALNRRKTGCQSGCTFQADDSVTTCTLTPGNPGSCAKEAGAGTCVYTPAPTGTCAYVTPGEQRGGDPHTYDHYYEYENFHVGPVDPSVFAQPCGIPFTSNSISDYADRPAAPCPGNCDGSDPFRTATVCPDQHHGIFDAPAPAPAGSPDKDCFCDGEDFFMNTVKTVDEGCAISPGTDEEEAAAATACTLTPETRSAATCGAGTDLNGAACAITDDIGGQPQSSCKVTDSNCAFVAFGDTGVQGACTKTAGAGTCNYMATGACTAVISTDYLDDVTCPGAPLPPCVDDPNMGYMPGGCSGLKASLGCDADLHTAMGGQFERWMPEGTLLSSRCLATCETCPAGPAAKTAKHTAAIAYMKAAGCCEPTLPSLPTQFSAVISANIIQGARANGGQPYSVHMHEWVDGAADKSRTDLYSERAHGTSMNVYDYADNVYWHVAEDGTGSWGDMAHIENNRMGGGGAHVTSTASMLRFGGDMEEVYIGRQAVRGIMCDKWVAKSGWPGSSMQLDWYFAASGWSIPEDNGDRVPIRLQLTGSSQRFTREGCTVTPTDAPSCVGTGNNLDGAGNACALNWGQDACAVPTGDCVNAFAGNNPSQDDPATECTLTPVSEEMCVLTPSSTCTGNDDGTAAATCGAGKDGAGNDCAVNAATDGCVVADEICVFKGATSVTACTLNAAKDGCAVVGGDCTFVAEEVVTSCTLTPTARSAATCGAGSDLNGDACAVAAWPKGTCKVTDSNCAFVDGTVTTSGSCAVAAGAGTCVYAAAVETGSCAVATGPGTCNYVANHVPIGDLHVYDHIYDYTSFHVGPPDASVFDQPCGIPFISTAADAKCTGDDDGTGTACALNDEKNGCAVAGGDACTFVPDWKAATLAATPCAAACPACQIAGDLDASGAVNVEDVLALLSNFNVQC